MRRMNCPKSVKILAAVSIVFLLTVLFLPTIVVALVLPHTLIFGAGSLWDCSKIVSALVLLLCVPLIVIPCVCSNRRIWLFPLLLAILATATFAHTVFHNLFLAEGSGFTPFALLSLAALTLSTLLESFLTRIRMRIAPSHLNRGLTEAGCES
jgi:hypothetical protein